MTIAEQYSEMVGTLKLKGMNAGQIRDAMGIKENQVIEAWRIYKLRHKIKQPLQGKRK
jgi:hypothetical protein